MSNYKTNSIVKKDASYGKVPLPIKLQSNTNPKYHNRPTNKLMTRSHSLLSKGIYHDSSLAIFILNTSFLHHIKVVSKFLQLEVLTNMMKVPLVQYSSRYFLRVCLDLRKLKGKKKNLKSNFLFIVWFEESQKEKKLRGKREEKLVLL